MEGNSLEESCDPSGVQEGAELIASTSVDGTMQTPVLQRAPCCHSEPSAHRRVPPHQRVPPQQPTGVPWQELMPQVDACCAAGASPACGVAVLPGQPVAVPALLWESWAEQRYHFSTPKRVLASFPSSPDAPHSHSPAAPTSCMVLPCQQPRLCLPQRCRAQV